MAEVKIEEDLYELDNKIAAQNRESFKKNNIFVLNIMGSPGAGKTTLLENILPFVSKMFKTVVIEGDLATENDAERIRKMGVKAFQINTDGGCHLDAKMISDVYSDIDCINTELIIIENVGNLVCPISFDLGEDLRFVILSTPEGEDKPLKYPYAMQNTDAVIVTKSEIAEFVNVNIDKMISNINDVNPKAVVFKTQFNDGVYQADNVIEYIKHKVESKRNGK